MGAESKIVELTAEDDITQSSETLQKIELTKLTDLMRVDGDNISIERIDGNFKDKDILEVSELVSRNRRKIFSSFESITSNVIKTVRSMTDSSKTLDSIHSETSQLADYSSTIASAGEELSATINSISQNIQNTVSASGEAKSLAQNGNAVINSTLEKIENVSEVLSHTNVSLTKLKETAEQANTIVKVVNDISAKTDLLALNASIEAARAGAAGKGFAVVAHEVGRLSEKTQASINEIETILKNIQKNVDTVSNNLSIGTNSVNEAVSEVNEAKSTINSIVTQIEYVDNEVSNIGSAVKEQGHAVSDIANNVSTISKGSNDVNSKVTKLSDLIDTVTKGSNSTRNLLGALNLGGKSLLLQSQVDHLFWMHRLRRMLEGKENIQQDEFVDHTKCRLGKWYSSVQKDKYNARFRELYENLEAPHARLHSIAANVIRLYNSGEAEDAFRKYEECLPISVEIVSLLETMLLEVRE